MLRKVRHLVKVESLRNAREAAQPLEPQPAQAREDRKRVGRGPGSGKGRYSGRGIKGQKSRAGSHKMPAGFEGGQMPIFMRIGKLRGTRPPDAMPIGPFRTYTQPINLRDLDASRPAPSHARVARREGPAQEHEVDVKLLGDGELTKKLTVRVHSISAPAREKIEAAGGTIELLREPKVKKEHHHAAAKPVTAAAPATEDAPEAAEVEPEETATDEAAPPEE